MTKTFKQLQEADNVVGEMYAKNPDVKNTKFGYAWKKFAEKNYSPIIKELNEKLADNRLENALEDPNTKEILYANAERTEYRFSKEGLKKLITSNRAILEEYSNREFEITPFFSTYIPEDLTDEQREVLTGLVIE